MEDVIREEIPFRKRRMSWAQLVVLVIWSLLSESTYATRIFNHFLSPLLFFFLRCVLRSRKNVSCESCGSQFVAHYRHYREMSAQRDKVGWGFTFYERRVARSLAFAKPSDSFPPRLPAFFTILRAPFRHPRTLVVTIAASIPSPCVFHFRSDRNRTVI